MADGDLTEAQAEAIRGEVDRRSEELIAEPSRAPGA